MVLWCLEEYEKERNHENDDRIGEAEYNVGPISPYLKSVLVLAKPRLPSERLLRRSNVVMKMLLQSSGFSVMENMARTRSDLSVLVDDSQQAVGLITFKLDVVVQLAPPCMDSNLQGDGFFESALQRTGCHVNNGTI
ncbi:hypothetical protein TIFTF001_006735 [Ficus carica]|uniref:Uncharacterized protein n=1 Tax=Ficus carica TaxID=3494 RepID=A0AA87ZPK9_FICCA|nr:hypothetical protein TIFTF001_006735 [Ficus carica]